MKGYRVPGKQLIDVVVSPPAIKTWIGSKVAAGFFAFLVISGLVACTHQRCLKPGDLCSYVNPDRPDDQLATIAGSSGWGVSQPIQLLTVDDSKLEVGFQLGRSEAKLLPGKHSVRFRVQLGVKFDPEGLALLPVYLLLSPCGRLCLPHGSPVFLSPTEEETLSFEAKTGRVYVVKAIEMDEDGSNASGTRYWFSGALYSWIEDEGSGEVVAGELPPQL